MAEKKSERPVSPEEINQITEENPSSIVILGYLSTYRTSTDSDKSLRKIHEDSIAKLIPGSDYDVKLRMYGEAFNYLVENAKRFHIKLG